VALFDSLIQRLEDARVDRSDHVNSRVEFFIGHSCFPCVRKAPFHSGIAETHDRDGKADQHLLPVGETFDRMRITIELAKIGFLNVNVPHDFGTGIGVNQYWSVGFLRASLQYSNLILVSHHR
jgi:hypothetical protein